MTIEQDRILIIEDERSLADTVRYNLEREGFAVIVAADGEQGLERFRAERPSLVILDLMLPRLSGLDVCRIIRRAGIARPGPVEEVVVGGPVEMDVARHEVRIRGASADLPPKEFDLLEAF